MQVTYADDKTFLPATSIQQLSIALDMELQYVSKWVWNNK